MRNRSFVRSVSTSPGEAELDHPARQASRAGFCASILAQRCVRQAVANAMFPNHMHQAAEQDNEEGFAVPVADLGTFAASFPDLSTDNATRMAVLVAVGVGESPEQPSKRPRRLSGAASSSSGLSGLGVYRRTAAAVCPVSHRITRPRLGLMASWGVGGKEGREFACLGRGFRP